MSQPSKRKKPNRSITREIAERMPWHLSNREIAKSYGTTARHIWVWRKAVGKINVPCQRGPDRLRRVIDWSIPVIQLSKIHGITRQRLYQIKHMLKVGNVVEAKAAIRAMRWK